MYDPALRTAILRVLVKWERLPESDLLSRLSPLQVVSYRAETLRDLAADALIEVVMVGDERVIRITERGRQTLGGTD